VRTLINAGAVLTPTSRFRTVRIDRRRPIEAVGPRGSLGDSFAFVSDFPGDVLAPDLSTAYSRRGRPRVDGCRLRGLSQSRTVPRATGVTTTFRQRPHLPKTSCSRLLPRWPMQLLYLPLEVRPAPALDRSASISKAFLCDARNGVHPAAHIQKQASSPWTGMFAPHEGAIRILTLAPELPHAIAVIRDAVERGITVAMGPHNATFEKHDSPSMRVPASPRTRSTPCEE
jgi:hypothetical protein